MHLYKINLDLNRVNRMAEFRKDNFIGMNWQDVGNLENVSKEEWEECCAKVNKYGDQELLAKLNEVSTFVYAMQDGDYVLVIDKDAVHLGDLGDYFYVDSLDTEEVDLCHRRGVTWIKSLVQEELHVELKQFLSEELMIAKFNWPVTQEQLERWLSKPSGMKQETDRHVHVDAKIIEEALDILKKAMRSEDADRRERAAIAILNYAK